jgi:hypothetical protein
LGRTRKVTALFRSSLALRFTPSESPPARCQSGLCRIGAISACRAGTLRLDPIQPRIALLGRSHDEPRRGGQAQVDALEKRNPVRSTEDPVPWDVPSSVRPSRVPAYERPRRRDSVARGGYFRTFERRVYSQIFLIVHQGYPRSIVIAGSGAPLPPSHPEARGAPCRGRCSLKLIRERNPRQPAWLHRGCDSARRSRPSPVRERTIELPPGFGRTVQADRMLPATVRLVKRCSASGPSQTPMSKVCGNTAASCIRVMLFAGGTTSLT